MVTPPQLQLGRTASAVTLASETAFVCCCWLFCCCCCAASRAVASLQRYVADERAAARYDLVLARGCDLSPVRSVEPIYYIFLITASLLTSTL